MIVVGFLGWRAARLRWRSYVAIGALVALTAGVSMFAIAGARRTESSYPRLLQAAKASTMTVTDFGAFDPKVNTTIAKLPGVVKSRTFVAFELFELVHGAPDFGRAFEADGSKDGEFFDQDRFTPTVGRRPDPSRFDEVAVNELAAAKFGYHVGQRLRLGTYNVPPTDVTFFARPPPPQLTMTATVVGIGAFPDEVVQDEGDRLPRMLLTPAYTHRAMAFATYGSEGLVLARGDQDVPALQRRISAAVPPGGVTFRATSVDELHGLRAIRPISVALGVFGGITGLAAIVLVAQAIGRAIRSQREQRSVLRAIGASPLTITGSALLAPVIALCCGALLAVALAIALSPLMPVGPVRRVETSPGPNVDATVLVLGGLVFFVVSLVAAAGYAVFDRPGSGRSVTGTPRRPWTSGAISAPLRPAGVIGLQFAMDRGEADAPLRMRSVMAGVAIAVTVLVGTAVFGASLVNLVDHPELYGWTGQLVLFAGNGYGNIPIPVAHGVLDRDHSVLAWSGAYFGHGSVDGADVPLLGMDPRSAVVPPVTSGRFLGSRTDAVLGGATAAQLHKRVGDTVTLSGPDGPHRLTIVGISTLPTIGLVHAAHTSLGEGMIVAHQLVPGYDRDITGQQSGDLGPRAIFIRYRPDTALRREQARLGSATAPLFGLGGIDVLAIQLPAEITSSQSVTHLPLELASGLGLAMVLSLVLALRGTVRGRRSDFAVLRAIGFTGRQLVSSVSWLAATTVVVGLLIGVPLGVVLGRTAWQLFAEQMYVVDSPTVPVLVLLGVGVGAIVLTLIVATTTGARARRSDVAAALRVG